MSTNMLQLLPTLPSIAQRSAWIGTLWYLVSGPDVWYKNHSHSPIYLCEQVHHSPIDGCFLYLGSLPLSVELATDWPSTVGLFSEFGV